ncbi:MAG TPA: hypothetical protein VNM48_13955 [Chloroflexota bacterium]|nr:hypothetical protein [Chloroflexota bacterium]
MTALTTDPADPRLKRGPDTGPTPQHDVYLVLSGEDRAKGFVRPVRTSYKHTGGKACGVVTRMGQALSETYARDPKFYGFTYCVGCQQHFAVDEFVWDADGLQVGS